MVNSDGDRVELGEDDDAGLVGGVHDVAGVDLPQADASGDRARVISRR